MATPLKKLTHFFQTHPVFTFDEASQFLTERGTAHRGTQKALLSYHQKRGRVLRVRRGLSCHGAEGRFHQTPPARSLRRGFQARSRRRSGLPHCTGVPWVRVFLLVRDHGLDPSPSADVFFPRPFLSLSPPACGSVPPASALVWGPDDGLP